MIRRCRLSARLVAAAAGVLVLTGCGEDAPPPQPVVRAIKSIVVKGVQEGQSRRISGTVESVNKSALAFEISGAVAAVRVKVGDRVKKGQILAEIDKKQYQLNAQSARAELNKAQSNLREKETVYKAKLNLFNKQIESKIAMEKAKADFKAARSAVEQARVKLELAQRDLRNTGLRAPFDGVISSREVEPAVVVTAGKPVLEIQGDGDLEVALNLPEQLAKFVKQGDSAKINFPTLQNRVFDGRIRQISSRGGEANTYPVTVLILSRDPGLRPGMTAEVNIVIRRSGARTVYPIPVSAVTPGPKKVAYVFRFDKSSSTVKRIKVKTIGVQGNDIQVSEGLKNGDIIAVAGVSFLHDGMKVRLVAGR